MEKRRVKEDSPGGEGTVIDSAFVFDLETAQILGQMFYLSRRWLVTDLVKEELKTPNVPMLEKMGLEVVTLSGDQIAAIAVLARKHVGPSVQDLSALICARDSGVPLVTRDGDLRTAAKAEGVTVLSTIDILTELVAEGVLLPADAADALQVIQDKRLNRPRSDWAALIRKWRSM